MTRLIHHLTIKNVGSLTSHLPDRVEWHLVNSGYVEEIDEYTANRYIAEGVKHLGGVVERPFHRFYGYDLNDAIEKSMS